MHKFLPIIITFKLFRNNSLANSKPIPDAPPVISATLPSIINIFDVFIEKIDDMKK